MNFLQKEEEEKDVRRIIAGVDWHQRLAVVADLGFHSCRERNEDERDLL